MQPCERLLVILAQIQSLCQIYNREKMKLETPKDRKGTARIKRAGSSVLHEREALRNHQPVRLLRMSCGLAPSKKSG